MPKERVYGSELPQGEDGPGVAAVEVLWGREQGYVQVVSKCVHRSTGERLVSDADESHPEIHYTDGFYVDLDRSGINKLIRDLRRARDQAFGRDE